MINLGKCYFKLKDAKPSNKIANIQNENVQPKLRKELF